MAAFGKHGSANIRMACILLVCLLLFELAPNAAHAAEATASAGRHNNRHGKHHLRHGSQRHNHRHHPQHAAAAATPANRLDAITVNQVQQCYANVATMELCQRCASVTKSMEVFPLCCANEDDVRDWCEEYLNFGKE